jgi:hypothetical protein
MGKRDRFTQVLAFQGAVFVWLPILAPVFLSLIVIIKWGKLFFDYLMPAELFAFFLVGGIALIWAAIQARARRGWIGWGYGAALALLVGSQGLAWITGLASGETEPTGWWWGIVVGLLVAYALANILVGLGGLLLLRDIYKKAQPPQESVSV